jgi:hypothetical protein
MGMFQVDPVLSMIADFEAFLDIPGPYEQNYRQACVV